MKPTSNRANQLHQKARELVLSNAKDGAVSVCVFAGAHYLPRQKSNAARMLKAPVRDMNVRIENNIICPSSYHSAFIVLIKQNMARKTNIKLGIAANATARRFRRKVSGEMQARLPAQTSYAKMRDRGGIGGQVFGVRAN
jgi:hypothetical protein